MARKKRHSAKSVGPFRMSRPYLTSSALILVCYTCFLTYANTTSRTFLDKAFYWMFKPEVFGVDFRVWVYLFLPTILPCVVLVVVRLLEGSRFCQWRHIFVPGILILFIMLVARATRWFPWLNLS